jgi:hypothetical protein
LPAIVAAAAATTAAIVIIHQAYFLRYRFVVKHLVMQFRRLKPQHVSWLTFDLKLTLRCDLVRLLLI